MPHLPVEEARTLENALREIMREFNIGAVYLVDPDNRSGIRYWSFGDGWPLLMTPANANTSSAGTVTEELSEPIHAKAA